MPEPGPVRRGLPPVAGSASRILILGAFPGDESLRRQQYYAHPRNLFWDMMSQVCGAGRETPYAERLEIVTCLGIALWDVVESCNRTGSMDAHIRRGSFTLNDFRPFLAKHPVSVIFFDGIKASQLFQRHVVPILPAVPELVVLPSTSPANAGMTRQEKTLRWLKIRDYL